MRSLLWFLVLFVLAAGLAVFGSDPYGSVTLFWPPYRFDLSLNFVLVSLIAVFLIMHAALRGVAALLELPREARRWRQRHQERAQQQSLLDVITYFLSGRYLRARKAADNVISQTTALLNAEQALPWGRRMLALAHLLAAECAHALQDRTGRDEYTQKALDLLAGDAGRDEQELRDGVQLRMTRWAYEDRDATKALQHLAELPQGVAHRLLALRLRLRITRLAGQSAEALETVRRLNKHRAFSPTAARNLVRVLTAELLRSARDAQQVQTLWEQMDAEERAMPEVALAAVERLLDLGGDFGEAQSWLLPVWEQAVAPDSVLAPELQLRLVRLLERGFGQSEDQPDAAWLARIEAAQMSNPRDALLQYLAGMACVHLQLWGKAQQLLNQSLKQLDDGTLRRHAWVALAMLAEQREDGEAALAAWKEAARQED